MPFNVLGQESKVSPTSGIHWKLHVPVFNSANTSSKPVSQPSLGFTPAVKGLWSPGMFLLFVDRTSQLDDCFVFGISISIVCM